MRSSGTSSPSACSGCPPTSGWTRRRPSPTSRPAAGRPAVAVTLLTGSSTGIGFATALHCARHGHRVVATMRNLVKAAPLEAAARAESLPLEILELDVTRKESIERAVATTVERHRAIDV